jgi:hypothetical protein
MASISSNAEAPRLHSSRVHLIHIWWAGCDWDLAFPACKIVHLAIIFSWDLIVFSLLDNFATMSNTGTVRTYSPSVRVGNWQEDKGLAEVKYAVPSPACAMVD